MESAIRSWAIEGPERWYAGETTRDLRAGVFCPCGADVDLAPDGLSWRVTPRGASARGWPTTGVPALPGEVIALPGGLSASCRGRDRWAITTSGGRYLGSSPYEAGLAGLAAVAAKLAAEAGAVPAEPAR